ncbi:VWA domain-containing protein [Thalassococcus sp. CAU 1522]|uniref:VWA domain-containing protein n=2 Tax=Thalassococcus arenae TaxID=2851652 RepID=A0ABS6N5B7_9RHOB|nr:VWA domain-containing protein [Thalassococcus arenae]
MIVFDGSGSMAETGFNQIGEARIFEARAAMRRALPGIASARRLGLIVYGPGEACQSVDLLFGPEPDAASRIIGAVDALEPAGDTPLTEAVFEAARVLDYRARPGAIVLVTDGKETCGGAPCQLAAELAADGADLTVHVIGFKVRGEHFGWASQGETDYTRATAVARCLADRTGGLYVSAETVDELVSALRVTLGCAVLGLAAPATRLR